MVQTKLCGLDVVPPGSIKQFTVKEREVLVINSEGKYYCLDARCTHAGAPLAEGTLDGEVLTCPWHGSQFRITDGKVLRGPTTKELRTYSLLVRDDFLFIEL
jgi:nitrite reductase/ring-hydroxylating ferredoxin subunit